MNGGVIYPPMPSPGFYGDGSDGALVVDSGTTQISGYKYYTTVVVSAGATLETGGWGVYATQSITNAGTISQSGDNASGATGGFGGSNGYGTDGGSGVVNAAGAGPDYQISIGGLGGDGGASTVAVHPGGVSDANLFPAPRQSTRLEQYSNYYGVGGGAGGGSAAHAGGGGGGGGGYIQLQAPLIANTGTIAARGGNGAAGTGGTAGGGGGGGGGVIWLIARAIANTGTINVTGGTGGAGAGGAVAGAVGSDGYYIPLT